MADNEQGKWRRLPKMSFSSKDLTKRMKRVEGATMKHARRFVVKRWSNFKEARRRIALWVVAFGVIIGAAGLQYLWYQQDYRTTANAVGGTYAEALLGPVDTLNPLFAKSSAEEVTSELLFSRLLTYDTSGKINFDLADSMKVSEDGKSYTLTIRPDARWSDDLYVRARDVVFTVNLVKNSAVRSTLTGWSDITVKEVDERTVQFNLPSVYAAFPHALRSLPILPEHSLRDIEPSRIRESSFGRNPIGSGPFNLRLSQDVDSANGRKVIHLSRSENYYKGPAKLDRIQLHIYKDIDSIKRALATSEVNAASDLSVTAAKDVNQNRYIVENRPVNSGVYALFNTTNPITKDVKVRQALLLATNTAALRKGLSDGLPALHLPFLDSQVNGTLPKAPAYDATKAAALLDEAGWKMEGQVRKKEGQPLVLSVVTTKNPDYETALSILTDQWRKVGVTVTTTIVDPTDTSQNVAQDILQPRLYDVLLYRLTIGGDPDVYAYWHSSQATTGAYNLSNYSSVISDDALSSARIRTEQGLRDAKYVTFAQQWAKDVPAIGLYQATAQYVHTQNVHAIPSDSTLVSPVDRYGSVRYWSVGSRTVFKTP